MTSGASSPSECDVLVVGSGAAGLTAALVAAIEGLKVVICEKEPRIGGTTAISGGTCWVPGNHLADPDATGADVEEAARYLADEIGDNDPGGRRRAFLESARQAFEFLEKNSHVRFTAPAHYPDYHPSSPGASLGGRAIQPLPFDGRLLGDDFERLADPLHGMTILGGMMVSRPESKLLVRPFASRKSLAFALGSIVRLLSDRRRHRRGTRLLLGNALVARLVLSLRERNVPILLGRPMERLLLDGGRVAGACVAGQEIRARKAVILATGGFTSSPEMRARLLPPEVTHGLSAPGATGDGLKAVAAVGGRLDANHVSRSFCMPVSELKIDGKRTTIFPHVIVDRARPGVIAVDRSGNRFVNEGNSYHDFVEAMIAGGRDRAYLICDRASLRKFGLGLIRPVWQWLPYYRKRGYFASAETIAGLAGKIGVDPIRLEATVARYNGFCEAGTDEDFGKGSNALNLMYGDSSVGPNPCLSTIEKAPFIAVTVTPAAIGASAGIETDADARVLGSGGQPIPRLFACGNDMASIMRGHYAGAGITLGPAITFAYRAARKAVE